MLRVTSRCRRSYSRVVRGPECTTESESVESHSVPNAVDRLMMVRYCVRTGPPRGNGCAYRADDHAISGDHLFGLHPRCGHEDCQGKQFHD